MTSRGPERAFAGIATAALVAAAVLASGAATADETGARNSYISDSSGERTPLITAFPKYPEVARRDRIEGEATVCFTVNARGRVVRPSVRQYSHKIFRNPALRAARASSFEPLVPGESVSPLKTCRTYRFRLEPIVADNNEDW